MKKNKYKLYIISFIMVNKYKSENLLNMVGAVASDCDDIKKIINSFLVGVFINKTYDNYYLYDDPICLLLEGE